MATSKKVIALRPRKASEKAAPPLLDAEFANRLRDPFEQAWMGVLQTNDPLLIERGSLDGAIYADLERDGKVFDGLQKRRLALIGKSWTVEPMDDKAPGSEEAVEKVTSMLKAASFDKLCAELMGALLGGMEVAEIVWTLRDNMVVPDRVVHRARRRFKYVQEDEHKAPQLHLLTRTQMLKGEPVPERKFIVHRVNPKDDNPYGTGLGLQLFWPVFFKRKGIVAWNKLCDRFGSPTPHGKYPRGATQKEKNTLADALRAMSSDGYLMTPEGMEIALIESKLSGNVTTQQQLCEYMDDWIGSVLTGQERRGNSGGAQEAASKERQEVREDLTQADSDLLSETINATLLKWICELNGLPRCLVYRQIKQEEDLEQMAKADKLLHEMGYELDEATVRSRYGEGWSKKKEPEPTQPPVAGPAKKLPGQPDDDTANFAEPRDRDALDDLVDQAMGHWQPMLKPISTRLQAEIDASAAAGETAQQLLARLPALFSELDADPLHEALAQTTFAARIGANADLPND